MNTQNAFNFFIELLERARPVKYGKKPHGIYIKGNFPVYCTNQFPNTDILKHNLKTLTQNAKIYIIKRATFWRGQFKVNGKTIAVVWHKEADGIEWIEIIKNPKKKVLTSH